MIIYTDQLRQYFPWIDGGKEPDARQLREAIQKLVDDVSKSTKDDRTLAGDVSNEILNHYRKKILSEEASEEQLKSYMDLLLTYSLLDVASQAKQFLAIQTALGNIQMGIYTTPPDPNEGGPSLVQ